ncbi:NAD(P) transhydrogenase subunit alpha [Psychrosphaera sp. B3R10]|uniref:NAD(P) transhydrogenase subunit alpha n=1 Tax=unclassified Psychrosphaera TaxID=2641570 RepID=UPI001C09E766|nr:MULTISPECIES: NAD(P) transhydrogenase subunit alpha [unclassified Psychrosphaera]MBU2883549.1 NAD(P) transhydrogenase subunit alpha [Psychrosphaera sp. I2R16]MBU2989728.1 NAD(P) transhydrogenase subunit alpha [Psychrosphaera sp. B3R10]MDO6719817.1 NAD(P) transhydrogenase subunit alpha [Psychrosphaera sp. 1_MG-2023]
MTIFAFPKELTPGENRCALLPGNVKAYALMGVDVQIETGLGEGLNIDDQVYIDAGATVVNSRVALLSAAEVVMSIDKLPKNDLRHIAGNIAISFLDPFNDLAYVENLRQHNVTSFSMEMIPRSTRCQKMDALSSQASLAGYVMVSKAVDALNRIMPMMMTAAGTIKPAKVFIIGAGVAGLQAIATAKRLGATVTAFDTRSVVAEQVQSLGAKFLNIDLGDTGQTNQGYATALSPEQLEIQHAAQAKCIAESDIVITTAQLFGRKPPRLINQQTISQMKPGSVVVDMAAESGGNVEGSVPKATVEVNGVTIIGTGNWANEVAYNASQMYANNVLSLVSEFWDKENKHFLVDLEDDIQNLAVITHGSNVINSTIKELHQDFMESNPSTTPAATINLTATEQ